jgi:hypothetical protein
MSKIGTIRTVLNTLGIITILMGAWFFYTGCCNDADHDNPKTNNPDQPKTNNPAATTPASAPATTDIADQQDAVINDTYDPSKTASDTSTASCPYLYTWNGTSYVLDNDIIPFKGPSLENTDYYRIQQPLKPEDGYYKVRIAEELPETSYLDSVKLITVDHPAAVEVYPDLKGNMFNISNPRPLVSCVDSYGNDCLDMLKGREEVYTPGTYFEGNQGEYIIADFGNLSGNKIIKLVVTSDGPVDTSPTPVLNPGSSPGGGGSGGPRMGCSILIVSLATQNGITDWETKFVFTPHELWATNVFDITNMLPDANGEYKLRFYFTKTHKVDFIGIDTTPEIDKEVHELAPVFAKAGEDALSRLADIDGKYLVMKNGDELFLKFPYQPAKDRSNFKRDFVFVSRGYYIPDQK